MTPAPDTPSAVTALSTPVSTRTRSRASPTLPAQASAVRTAPVPIAAHLFSAAAPSIEEQLVRCRRSTAGRRPGKSGDSLDTPCVRTSDPRGTESAQYLCPCRRNTRTDLDRPPGPRIARSRPCRTPWGSAPARRSSSRGCRPGQYRYFRTRWLRCRRRHRLRDRRTRRVVSRPCRCAGNGTSARGERHDRSAAPARRCRSAAGFRHDAAGMRYVHCHTDPVFFAGLHRQGVTRRKGRREVVRRRRTGRRRCRAVVTAPRRDAAQRHNRDVARDSRSPA